MAVTLAQSRKIGVAIAKTNPRFKPIIEQSGPCPIGLDSKRPVESNFSTLASSILSQQLSSKAAATIIARVKSLSGGRLSPTGISRLSRGDLRKAGCSNSKARALAELAEAALSSQVSMSSLHRLGDQEIRDQLLPLFGIGLWTVEMFLMFQLGRQDVWPVGDLGVRRGWQKVHRMRREIKPSELLRLGEAYSPYRSHLAWYCWRATEIL
ncbi:MAG: DNA-3-methyladenine glycosylase 2 family protein [Actinobacteria bacterium]|nr:DNA-3-methyladenine glycosylase 2 family protein [Actinomycetota bacterium]